MYDPLPRQPRPRINVRLADWRDIEAINRLRERQDREFIGEVPLIAGLTFFVAEVDGEVVACSGGSYVPDPPGEQRRAIVTDFYDDGTKNGKRGLLALLDDAMRARVKLYIQLPFDRPELHDFLERKGVRWVAWAGEYP